MSRLLDLFDRRPVVTDGAWATELQKHGLPPNTPSDSWNLTHPDAVEGIARSYVRAGSRLLLTNTFRANPSTLQELGLGAHFTAINRRAVELGRRAATQGERVRLFGSIGPIGHSSTIEPRDRPRLRAAFADQATVLAGEGVDGLVLETFGGLEEALLAVEAVLEAGLPTVISFTFHAISAVGIDPSRSIRPEVMAARMAATGVDAIGANCGSGFSDTPALCRRLRSACDLLLWMKPNAGPVAVGDGSPAVDAFVASLREAAHDGAHFLGGCCGVSPAMIGALATRLGRPDDPPESHSFEAPARALGLKSR